jgi:hypothetical protein
MKFLSALTPNLSADLSVASPLLGFFPPPFPPPFLESGSPSASHGSTKRDPFASSTSRRARL